jgi:short-subunit dehydrogenase
MKNVKKIIMITGISSGVGESLTKFFLSQNFKVIGMARRIEMVKKKFSNHPNLFFYKTDLSKVNDLKMNLQKIKRKFDYIPYIINNAAIFHKCELDNISINDIQDSLQVNFFSIFLIMKKFIPLMEKNKFGRVINITSGAPFNCFPDFLGYSTSKSALNTLTITFANKLKSSGVKINLMSPGPVKSEMSPDSKIKPDICHQLVCYLLNNKKNCPTGKFFWIDRELPLFPDHNGINWLKGKADNAKFPRIKE